MQIERQKKDRIEKQRTGERRDKGKRLEQTILRLEYQQTHLKWT